MYIRSMGWARGCAFSGVFRRRRSGLGTELLVDAGPAARARNASRQGASGIAHDSGGGVGSSRVLGRERRRPETAYTKKRRQICARNPYPRPCRGRVVSRRACMGSVLRRMAEVVEPLVSELSGAGQGRAESSRGVLLGVYFLLLLLMVGITIPVRRFRFESRCSSRRRAHPHRRLGRFPRRRWPWRLLLLVRGKKRTLSRFALSSAQASNRPIRSKKCPNPQLFHTRSPLHLPGILPSNGSRTKPPRKPRLGELGKHPQLTCKRDVGSGSS